MGRADTQTIMRVVALLISFAGLSFSASTASWPVRFLLLAILRRAEAIARLYALGDGVPALAPVRVRPFDDPSEELASLSIRFRVLAMTLLVAAARSSRALPDRGMQSAHTDRITAVEARAGRIADHPDTS